MSELFSLDCFIRWETTKDNWTHRSDVSANTICGFVTFVLIYWEVRANFISTQIWRFFDSVLKPLHSCFDKSIPRMINCKEIFFFFQGGCATGRLTLCPYFPVPTPQIYKVLQINASNFYPKKLNSLSSLEKLNNNIYWFENFRSFGYFRFTLVESCLRVFTVCVFLSSVVPEHFITFSTFPHSASAAPTHTCSLLLLVAAAATHLICLFDQFSSAAPRVSFCSDVIAAVSAFLFS